METNNLSKEIVLSCINALNKEDFDKARMYMNDDMIFEGVLGSRNGADAYFKDMKQMKLKYDIIKAFSNGDDVCLIYNVHMGQSVVFGCGLYHVKDNRIDSLKVVFDPRPVLEAQQKNKA